LPRWLKLTLAAMAVILAALYFTGRLDYALYPVGLNFHACGRNGFGATFCGSEPYSGRPTADPDDRAVDHPPAAGRRAAVPERSADDHPAGVPGGSAAHDVYEPLTTKRAPAEADARRA